MCLALFACMCSAVCSATAFQRAVEDDSPADLKAVEVFQRDATFVAKDRQVRFLKVSTAGEPNPVFRLNWVGDLNCQIALAKDKEQVIVTDGKAIYYVREDGNAQKLCTLAELQPEGAEEKGVRGSIYWFFATSKSRDVLFFVVSLGVKQSVCKLELETKKLHQVAFPFAAGIDVDVDAGIVYGPVGPTFKQVLVKHFDGTLDKSFPTSADYYLCRLSSDKKHLLLSAHDLPAGQPIALMDTATGGEKALPIRGSHATWGTDNTIFFLRGSNSLWRYQIGDPKPTEVFTVSGRGAPGYSIVPQLSVDKTWLAWEWSSKTDEGFKNGTILIDLKNKEYRQLKGWWYNVQWLQDACSNGN